MSLPAEGAARRGSILVLFLEGWPSPPALPFPYRQSIHPLLPRLTTALQLPCTIIATPPNLGFLTCKLDLLVCVHASKGHLGLQAHHPSVKPTERRGRGPRIELPRPGPVTCPLLGPAPGTEWCCALIGQGDPGVWRRGRGSPAHTHTDR